MSNKLLIHLIQENAENYKQFLRNKSGILLTIFGLSVLAVCTLTSIRPEHSLSIAAKSVVVAAGDSWPWKDDHASHSESSLYDLPSPFYLHYIRFSPLKLRFVDYLSIMSGVQYLKPDGILIHGDVAPSGEYWDKLVAQKLVRHVLRNKTVAVGQRLGRPKKVAFMEHSADLAKLDVLLEYGGIAIDFDVFFVRGERVKRILQQKKALVCYGDIDGNNIGFVGAHKDSKYLSAWRQSYRDIYVADWNFNQCMVGRYLSIVFKEEVYSADQICNNPHPDGGEMGDYFHGYGKILWKQSIAIHSFERLGRVPIDSPKDLESGNMTTQKELLLSVYKNSTLPPVDLSFRDEVDPVTNALTNRTVQQFYDHP
ncbi:hypothetical protein BV898_11306 [Hypsibius exemplaris]|uniref:Uncharacterized protein n=1 Tax=Hypsibius exemplaris TaxID=2072580 RepID=A0A1W0WGY9_HYPEX|nr:hypothetical protein BV898_11306 [Hypsibius exemplaris]